jgi:hypothetical protein
MRKESPALKQPPDGVASGRAARRCCPARTQCCAVGDGCGCRCTRGRPAVGAACGSAALRRARGARRNGRWGDVMRCCYGIGGSRGARARAFAGRGRAHAAALRPRCTTWRAEGRRPDDVPHAAKGMRMRRGPGHSFDTTAGQTRSNAGSQGESWGAGVVGYNAGPCAWGGKAPPGLFIDHVGRRALRLGRAPGVCLRRARARARCGWRSQA